MYDTDRNLRLRFMRRTKESKNTASRLFLSLLSPLSFLLSPSSHSDDRKLGDRPAVSAALLPAPLHRQLHKPPRHRLIQGNIGKVTDVDSDGVGLGVGEDGQVVEGDVGADEGGRRNGVGVEEGVGGVGDGDGVGRRRFCTRGQNQYAAGRTEGGKGEPLPQLMWRALKLFSLPKSMRSVAGSGVRGCQVV
jgi:hypothetical protein